MGMCRFSWCLVGYPGYPLLVEDNPKEDEVIADPQTQWARHHRTMLAAKEHFIAVETDSIIKKALKQRIYTNPNKINNGDWVYFRRNQERYWKGPAKVVLKDRKSLHCILEGNSLIINSDDVLLNKPGVDPEYEENFTFLPSKQQPPASIISNQSSQPELEAGVEKPNDAKDVTPLADTTKASVPKNYDAHTKSGLVLQTGTEATSQVGRFDSN